MVFPTFLVKYNCGSLKIKQYFYRGKHCLHNICYIMNEMPLKLINFEHKKMLPLKIEQLELCKNLKYIIQKGSNHQERKCKK